MLEFDVECQTEPGQYVAVCGTGPLGDWTVARALVLCPERYPNWRGEVDTAGQPAEFKYVLVRRAEGGALTLVRWEADGANRRADPAAHQAARLVLHHQFGNLAQNSVEVHALPDVAAHYGAPPSEVVPVPHLAAHRAEAERPDEKQMVINVVPSDTPVLQNGHGGTAAARNHLQVPCTVPAKAADENLLTPRSEGANESVLDMLDVHPSVNFARVTTDPGAFQEKYELNAGHVLGTGMSGGVCLAKMRSTGVDVAVKTLPTEGCTPQQVEQILAEVQNQLAMDHPNICRLLEVFEEKDRLLLVMERMRGKDLYDHLSRNGRYTERDAAACIRQMCAAVAYCHRQGICHRDLKLENFCLEDTGPHARVKLIDFGLSASFDPSVPMTDSCGTLYYVAPEVLHQQYGPKCDMWSLGVIAYVLLAGRTPFAGANDRETARLICRGQFRFDKDRWSHISDDAREFVSKLLEVNVDLRMDSEEALAHRWLASGATAGEAVELDWEVLRNLKKFTESNALRRAMLRALTPLATVDEVARWASLFEALDPEGTGFVEVRELTKQLVDPAMLDEEEAAALCTALASADEGEQISYSAFLAACLSSHTKLDDEQLRCFFERLDADKTGTLSVDEVCNALGDLVDPDELHEEFQGKMLTYSDFKWVMTRPRIGPTVIGLHQLIGVCEDLTHRWKVSSRRARCRIRTDASECDDELEASRRENMAWRMWTQHMTRRRVGTEEVDKSPAKSPIRGYALVLDAYLAEVGLLSADEIEDMPRMEKRAILIADLAKQGVAPASELQELGDEVLVQYARRPRKPTVSFDQQTTSRTVSSASSPSSSTAQQTPLSLNSASASASGALSPNRMNMKRTPTTKLVRHLLHRRLSWEVALAESKEGTTEAIRRENLAWRMASLEQHRKTLTKGMGGA